MPSPLVSSPDPASQRLVRRSRIVSYVLAGLGVVVLSLAPSVLGEPQDDTVRVLLDVVRPIVAAVLIVAALAVQVVVGVRWRRDLAHQGDEPASDHPHDQGDEPASDHPHDHRDTPRDTA